RRYDSTDKQGYLLITRRSADDIARLEILGSSPGVGCRNTDHAPHYKRKGFIGRTAPTNGREYKTGSHQRRDGHPRHRAVARTDESDNATGHRDKEESKDDNENTGQQLLKKSFSRHTGEHRNQHDEGEAAEDND